MKFETEVKILGMKSSKGQMDNGTSFDSTKVYVETGLDSSKGNAKGFSVAEYSFGTSEKFREYEHLSFPFLAKVSLEFVTNGKNQKMVMHSCTPLERAK